MAVNHLNSSEKPRVHLVVDASLGVAETIWMTIHVSRHLKMVPVETLLPYAKNSRTHSAAQIEQLVGSIKEFGFTNPILIDGSKGVIAGHGRLMAAKKLGLTEVPVVELSHLTPAQRRAYVIADNKIAMNAGWDLDILASEVAALGGELKDFGSIGFSDQELSDLLAGFDAPLAETSSAASPAPAPAAQPAQSATESVQSEPAPDPVDHAEHWRGMPEFTQENKSSVRHVIVHFADLADAAAFFQAIQQKDTGQTKSIWFPPQERMDTESKRYE